MEWSGHSQGAAASHEEGFATQSFPFLPRILDTLSQNRVNLAGVSFDRYSAPTSIQQRALGLLQLTPDGKPDSRKTAPAA